MQWLVKAVFTLWEAGTWTHWWLPTLTQLSIQLSNAMIHGTTHGGLSPLCLLFVLQLVTSNLLFSDMFPHSEKHPSII